MHNPEVKNATCFHAGILLGLSDPQDGGDKYLRKVTQLLFHVSIYNYKFGIEINPANPYDKFV
jgi:hypothetical protein